MSKLEGMSVDSGAIFDTTGTYRYTLWRGWSPESPQIAFIMLNPSTADEARDDPTIRRCIGFAKTWGYGALEVVNLFAYRADHPTALRDVEYPIGAENDRYLLQAIGRCVTLVLAWGTLGSLLDRDREVFKLLAGCKAQTLHCLGVTRDGYPRHPLYVKKQMRLFEFRVLPPAR